MLVLILFVALVSSILVPGTARAASGSCDPSAAAADQALLKATVDFSLEIFGVSNLGVPGMVMGITKKGIRHVSGFGTTRDVNGTVPNGKTLMRVGSLSKAFTGNVLASVLASNQIRLSDSVSSRLNWTDLRVPTYNGEEIKVFNLATHSSGFDREMKRPPSPPNNPFLTYTLPNMINYISNTSLLFEPSKGMYYSNVAFDLLAQTLQNATNTDYYDLFRERITGPLGMSDTTYTPTSEQKSRLFEGHSFAGPALPDFPNQPLMSGASGVYSTPDDVLTWLEFHLNTRRDSSSCAASRHDHLNKRSEVPFAEEVRRIHHAVWLQREGKVPAYGLDESGHADGISFGFLSMNALDDRPFILQKAGGLQGVFCFTAFAPSKGIGGFIAINKFDVNAATSMAKLLTDTITELAQR